MRFEKEVEEAKELREARFNEDILDMSLTLVIIRGPSIYVLINITVIIWLAQTIFVAKLEPREYPRSIYSLAPYVALPPINRLTVSSSAECPEGFEALPLHELPTISEGRVFARRKVFSWSEERLTFCASRLDAPPCFRNETSGGHRLSS